MSARDEILARVRSAQSGSVVSVARTYRPAGTVDIDIDQFVDRLVDYKATVHRSTEADLAQTIKDCVGYESVVCPAGIPSDWTVSLDVRLDEPELSTDQLDAIDAVLTTCALAIAETGTIILDHGPGQGRRALTLVPDHHVIVVRAEQVVASVPDAVAALEPGAALISAVQTWISGPSATSDIELNRVEGVHGPRRLDVILVP
jgi:L-lactate dehydrogenase complex protein LldG